MKRQKKEKQQSGEFRKLEALNAKKHLYGPYLNVFVPSACLMIMEIAAGRLIAAFVGFSIYTWTSVIGVVLGGLALGNYWGGVLADRFDAKRLLAPLFILAGISSALTPALNQWVGHSLVYWYLPWVIKILLHVVIIFLVPSILLGVISPVVAKWALDQGLKTGHTVGGIALLSAELPMATAFSGTAGAPILAVELSGAESSELVRQFKNAIVGSPAFIQKMRTEIKEASVVSRETALINPVASALSVPQNFSFTGIQAKVWFAAFWAIPVLAVAIAIPLLQKSLIPSLAGVPAAVESVASEVSAGEGAENRTLHASVLVLEGTEWNVKLIPMGTKDRTAVDFDRIRFANDQVASKNMEARGFQPTFYTVTTNIDGTILWETMQTGPNGERVFWRGEWKENGMSGVVSQQEVGGELKTFRFMGSR